MGQLSNDVWDVDHKDKIEHLVKQQNFNPESLIHG